MRMSGWLINDVQRFSAACIKIRQMLAQESKIPVHKQEKLEPIKGFVEFKDVSFHFSDDPRSKCVGNINFKIGPGQTLGILGETGSGKRP